ncbi:hypothetical protein ACFSQQ_40900 [Mesorhizobium kowhaii]
MSHFAENGNLAVPADLKLDAYSHHARHYLFFRKLSGDRIGGHKHPA